MEPKKKKRQIRTMAGVCGSKLRDKDLCNDPVQTEDSMKRFSCEK